MLPPAVAILVVATNAQPRAVRVNATLTRDILAQIDAFAEAHGYTRSGFLTRAAKRLMELQAV
jgi:uncharacterized protein (DUF1778 family)